MKIVLQLLILVCISACSGEKQTVNTKNKSCFSSKNFTQLKEYIQTRVKYSGMGKFYVEYPPDKTQPPDSIKRPSKHPENVYDIKYNKSLSQIIFENKAYEFIFTAEGLIYKKNQTEKDQDLADNIFCYLLSMANDK